MQSQRNSAVAVQTLLTGAPPTPPQGWERCTVMADHAPIISQCLFEFPISGKKSSPPAIVLLWNQLSLFSLFLAWPYGSHTSPRNPSHVCFTCISVGHFFSCGDINLERDWAKITIIPKLSSKQMFLAWEYFTDSTFSYLWLTFCVQTILLSFWFAT